jgi:hypothetical protein
VDFIPETSQIRSIDGLLGLGAADFFAEFVDNDTRNETLTAK